MSGTRSRLLTLVVACVLALSLVAGGGVAAPALADDDGPPAPPAAYFGNVTIDGEAAPEGTLVTAVVDGETRGSVVVGDAGRFGGPAFDDEKLEVPGTSADAGASVTFLVNGVPAETAPATVQWKSAEHRRVDIAAGPEAVQPPPGFSPPAPGESNITVTDAELGTERIAVGGEAEVTATVENRGEASGLTVLLLSVDGLAVDSEVVSLEAGEETTITFARTFDEPGEYDIAVDGVEAGTLTVGAADLQVTDASLSETEVQPGEPVDVTGTVENAGSVAGEATVELLIDGEAVDSRSVEVDAGASTEVAFEHAFEAEGEYAVAIDDASAGTVTVSDDGGGDGLPGFGPIAAIVAVLALVSVGRGRVT